jgi:CysZ protein
MRDFLLGISYLPQGFRLLWAPGLRRFVALPILINLVVFALLFWLGFTRFALLVEWLLPDPQRWSGEGWLEQALQFAAIAARWLLWPLFLLAATLVAFYTFTLVANLIGAPFNGALSARVQLIASGAPPPESGRSLLGEAAAGIAAELRKYRYFALLALPLAAAFFVPGLNLLAPVLWAGFAAWMLALEYLDYPMANQGLTLPQQRALLRPRRMLVLGFGAGVLAMTVIPVLNLLAMPTAVIAATLLWLREGPTDGTVTAARTRSGARETLQR